MWLIIIGLAIVSLLLWYIGSEINLIRRILVGKMWEDHTNSKEYKDKHSWKSIERLLRGKS